jgi:lysine-specific demethylase/histidyl-hydroxylase NO66
MLSDLEALLAPYPLERFRAEVQGRRPLHIPADSDDRKRALLRWSDFNRLLGQDGIWTSNTLRLMVNRSPVAVQDYCQTVRTTEGQAVRPVPKKVELFLNSGASLIANEVQSLHLPIGEAATALSRAFSALVGANIYCSFENIQAFGPHYDVHDVFAVQTEGTKVWRIYEQQLDMPVDLPPNGAETLRWLEETRGRLVNEITMKPGDVLYLPRGRFHDALATEGESLHVTFSVTALYGRVILSLLDNAAIQFPLFRAYFPPADQDGGRALSEHLAQLSGLVADIVASAAFRDEVAMSQERLVPRKAKFALPVRRALQGLAPTGSPFPRASTQIQLAYEWCAAQAHFSRDQMLAEFDFIEPQALGRAIDVAEQAGALKSVP